MIVSLERWAYYFLFTRSSCRDITMKGTGAGEHLLLDALKRTYEILQKGIGSMAVVVDPINENAINFYRKYGFVLLPNRGKIFLTMKAISKLFE